MWTSTRPAESRYNNYIYPNYRRRKFECYVKLLGEYNCYKSADTGKKNHATRSLVPTRGLPQVVIIICCNVQSIFHCRRREKLLHTIAMSRHIDRPLTRDTLLQPLASDNDRSNTAALFERTSERFERHM